MSIYWGMTSLTSECSFHYKSLKIDGRQLGSLMITLKVVLPWRAGQ